MRERNVVIKNYIIIFSVEVIELDIYFWKIEFILDYIE